MEALRRDTFEDVSSWAVDEFEQADLTCYKLNRSHKWPTNVDSFWREHGEFWRWSILSGWVGKSSSLHLFLGSPKSLPNPKEKNRKSTSQ